MKILAINPGGMSTKIAVYDDDFLVLGKSIAHTMAELEPYETIAEQKEYRKGLILKTLKESGIELSEIDEFVVEAVWFATYKVACTVSMKSTCMMQLLA